MAAIHLSPMTTQTCQRKQQRRRLVPREETQQAATRTAVHRSSPDRVCAHDARSTLSALSAQRRTSNLCIRSIPVASPYLWASRRLESRLGYWWAGSFCLHIDHSPFSFRRGWMRQGGETPCSRSPRSSSGATTAHTRLVLSHTHHAFTRRLLCEEHTPSILPPHPAFIPPIQQLPAGVACRAHTGD